MRSVTATRVHWDTVLGDLGRVLPPASPSTRSTAVRAGRRRRGAVAARRQRLDVHRIAGATSSHVRVALILDRLALLPWLSNVALQSTARSGDAINFSITATYVGGGGS